MKHLLTNTFASSCGWPSALAVCSELLQPGMSDYARRSRGPASASAEAADGSEGASPLIGSVPQAGQPHPTPLTRPPGRGAARCATEHARRPQRSAAGERCSRHAPTCSMLDISLRGGELVAPTCRNTRWRRATRAGALLRNQRARDTATCCRPASPVQAPPTNPAHAPGACHQRHHGFTLDPGRDELRVPLTVDLAARRHRHEDVRLPSRLLSHRCRVRRAQRQRGGVVRRVVRAIRTIDPAAQALVLQRRRLFASRGPAFYDGTKYQKLKIKNDGDARTSRPSRMAGSPLQHHFVVAMVPAAEQTHLHAAREGRTTCATRWPGAECRAGGTGTSRRRCSSVRSCRSSSMTHPPRARPRRGLRHADVPGAAAVLAAGVDAQDLRQLGRRDHRSSPSC